MAIYIEEEKTKNGSWFGFSVIFIVLIIVGISAYFMFFIKPEVIDVVLPVNSEVFDELSMLNFEPKDVISNNFFKYLKVHIPQNSLPPAGNSSPFGIF